MKPILLALVVVVSAAITGCGSKVALQTKVPPGRKGNPSPPAAAPEAVMTKIETNEDRAAYLAELGRDANFDPKQHVAMLQKYSNDPDQVVAEKAKELLERN